MEFRVLGAFEVWDGGQSVEIAGSKRRALLALLVLRANEVVRSELLIDELWGERPPRNAAAALQTHVSRLRKTLGANTIASREWGYVLRAAPAEIDLRRFEILAAQAEPLAARERASKLAEALALWRGPPLADLVTEPALQRDIARLEELRLSTLERRIGADLEAGNADVVGELETLVAQHPLREHLRWLLILALYRASRQAEALEVYRETRRVLTEELGLEPSPALKELEQAILRQDPSLDAKAAPPAHTEPPGVAPDEHKRRRVPPVAVLALLALGLAGTATAIALVRPGKGTSSATATEAIYETLTTTTANPATDTHRTTDRHKTTTAKNHTTAPPAHHTSSAATTTKRPSSTQTTTTVGHNAHKRNKQAPPPPPLIRVTDNFSAATLNPAIWQTWSSGSGTSFKVANRQLVFSIATDASFDPQYHGASSNIGTTCRYSGDFDARVDFSLLQWPEANGAEIALYIYQGSAPAEHISRTTSRFGDGYNGYPDGRALRPVPDKSGSLRIARSHGIVRMFFRHLRKWVQIGEIPISGAIWTGVSIETDQQLWQQQPVSAAFDNFKLTASDASC